MQSPQMGLGCLHPVALGKCEMTYPQFYYTEYVDCLKNPRFSPTHTLTPTDLLRGFLAFVFQKLKSLLESLCRNGLTYFSVLACDATAS